jgi:phage terminase large subunit GpA-like protein
MIASDVQFFRQVINLLPADLPPRLISEYVQGRRIMPSGTPFPGRWDNSLTPYWIEVMDSMSPFSPIRHGVLMKPRKMGATAVAENVAAYWVDANPTAVEYTTATDDLAEDWSTKRWDAVVDSLGFRHKFVAQTNVAKSRRTGDKVFKKQYMGGYFDIISNKSMAAKRAGDYRVQINDEIDGSTPNLVTGEGKWLELLHGHVTSWGDRAKIFDFSSPTTVELSEINREYQLGDCRAFLVPCPLCHREIELTDADDAAAFGIKGIFQANDGPGQDLVRAVYVCPLCSGEIINSQKTEMLSGGHWQPRKKSSDPALRSWQIGALYAPVGMISWTAYYRERMAAMQDPELMRTFQNIRRGLPYAETGARPDLRKVISLRGTYAQKEIQPGVIYLTAAIDVQWGSEKDPATGALKHPDSPPRLEMEILGHGRGYKTWSVDYRVFEGEIEDPFSGAWEILNLWATEGNLTYRRADGAAFAPGIILVDSSDGKVTHIVYGFCGRWQATFPCKGAKTIVADPERRERGDIAGTAYKRYRTLQIDANLTLWEVNTQFYKAALYNKLGTVMRRQAEPQASGFQDFPRDYADEYFAQLTAEEQLSDGSFRPVRARNEALDCRVYNMAGGDIYLMSVVENLRGAYRQQGATQKQLEMIGSKDALTWLEAQIPGGCRAPGCPQCGGGK